MSSTIQLLADTNEVVELFEPQKLYLKPIARLNVTVQLPQLKDPSQTISNWELMEKIKRMIAPYQFSSIKVVKTTLEFVRFEAEVENRGILLKTVKVLENSNLKVIGFFEPFKVKAAEAKSDFPTKHDWDSYFRDAKNVDETKPGERPDTVYFEKLPSKWFQDLRPNKGKDNREKNEPSEFVLRRVFETFGDIRCVDIPQIDPSRASSSTIKTFSFVEDFTFDAYVQYVEYISFMKAMDALRNMKLVHVDADGKAYSASIKVDFDRTKYLSDKNIRRRRIARERFMIVENGRLEKLRVADEEEKRRSEEERLRLEFEMHTMTKEKFERRQRREEKRRIKQLERKRQDEEYVIERKIKSETRRLIKAQRQLESMRLLSELFQLIKPIKLKEQVEKELLELEAVQKRENDERELLEKDERNRRERLMQKHEFQLRNKVLKKYRQIEEKREEYKREKLRDRIRSYGSLRSVATRRFQKPTYVNDDKEHYVKHNRQFAKRY